MASSTARLSAVLTLDDRASPGLVKTSNNANRLGADLRSAGQSLATFSSSIASLLVATGALDSKLGTILTSTFALSGALLSAIPAFQALNRVMRQSAAIQAFLVALRGPVGLALLATAGVAAVGTAAFLGGRALGRKDEQRETAAARPVTINNDLRGATIRGEDDLNELSRRVSRSVVISKW